MERRETTRSPPIMPLSKAIPVIDSLLFHVFGSLLLFRTHALSLILLYFYSLAVCYSL